MLAVSTPSIHRNRRQDHRFESITSQRSTSWTHRVAANTPNPPSVTPREKQQHHHHHHVESNVTTDDRLSPKVPRKKRVLGPWPDVLVFRLVTSRTLGDESDSDDVSWHETEHEEDEELNRDDEEEDSETEEKWMERGLDDEATEEDRRWWQSKEDKRTWEKRYWQADAAFRRRFGCAIDTPLHPELQRSERGDETRWRTVKFVLASLVLVLFFVQVALVVSVPLWTILMTTWRAVAVGNGGVECGSGGGFAGLKNDGQRGASLWPSDRVVVPEYVHTGLQLCAKLSRRVVESEHDTAANQHALRACDIAVNFAPESSRESIEAHVLRGDLHSLLLRFDRADEDYKRAAAVVRNDDRSNADLLQFMQALDVKILANRWTQLYATKRYDELRREAKARVALHNTADAEDDYERAASELAADWLNAFKKKKPVLKVLTLQRSWTLHRLDYDAVDSDRTSVR